MLSKNEIYTIIKNEIFSFTQIKDITKKHCWLKHRNIELPYHVLVNMQTLYDYLHDNKNKHCLCGNELKFNGFSYKRGSYQKFCSKSCLYLWRSKKMMGDNNNFHKVSKERQSQIGKENGLRLKRMILDGTFTPCVTNTWAKSRCIININRNDKNYQIKCRSSWDAFFQLKNPNTFYEKIRIPYIHNNITSNYIIDFVDEDKKILYEIKPDGFRETDRNINKFNAARSWAKLNGYQFIIIGNEWFKYNYDEDLLLNQPDEIKMKRLLKQFKLI